MRVSFTTVFADNHPPKDLAIEELKGWCRRFHDEGLTPSYKGSSLGNLSFRPEKENNSFIITASQLEMKDNLTDDMFVRVHSCNLSMGIAHASGVKEPSSESMLHFEIYRKRKAVGAIFHGHSNLILLHGEELDIPVTQKEEKPASTALVKSVLDILGNEPFLIMRNHGFLSLGRDMKEAGEQAVTLHEKCREC